MTSPTKSVFDRLFERAMVQDNGCWEFIGARYYNGYGVMRVDGRNIGTHRLAYSLCVEDIPEGMIVCHTCDNPPCCNPEHLFLGTHKDNMRDMYKKGRQGIGFSKLTQGQAAKIRERATNGEMGSELALEYNVSRATISIIKNNLTWINT